MAQKGRNDLTSVTGSNIYDNNNKEIDHSNIRRVLADYNDSKYNIKDDELKGVTYEIKGNTKITLEQHLNSIVGALPVYGTILGVEVGTDKSYSGSGIISSCNFVEGDSNDTLLEVNFSQSISNRRLIPVLTTESANWNAQNDIATPVIKRISGFTIHLALRQISRNEQNLNIEIIAL